MSEAAVDRPRFDAARAEAAVRELLSAVGEDPGRPGLKDTPARVARAYAETFAGLWQDPSELLSTTFDEDHDELVLVKDIPMYSTCEHHLVPFHGVAHIGYIPGEDGRVTGLSKLARLVEVYARRPQVQERMTAQIADASPTPSSRGGCWSSSRPSTCAWPCGASGSPGPRRSPRRSAASSGTTRRRGVRR